MATAIVTPEAVWATRVGKLLSCELTKPVSENPALVAVALLAELDAGPKIGSASKPARNSVAPNVTLAT